MPFTDDVIKCDLKPLRRVGLPAGPVQRRPVGGAAQAFPDGVCDWTKPGVDRVPTVDG